MTEAPGDQRSQCQTNPLPACLIHMEHHQLFGQHLHNTSENIGTGYKLSGCRDIGVVESRRGFHRFVLQGTSQPRVFAIGKVTEGIEGFSQPGNGFSAEQELCGPLTLLDEYDLDRQVRQSPAKRHPVCIDRRSGAAVGHGIDRRQDYTVENLLEQQSRLYG
ncbi:MAG: hypothetical protein P8Q36_05610, partial [Alphaproteobacteria bacterium]|nr:hypothetical protein [Alphaproteobacteria bacterium]